MSHFQKLFIGAVIGLCLGGCSAFDLLNAVAHRDVAVPTQGIAYGADARQKLDVLVPQDMRANSKVPVVIFFYGGSWKSGSRGDYRFAGEALASKGFVAVVPDYRLYPEVKFPAFQSDAATVLRWTYDHVTSYGGDRNAIFVMGHSAGAHMGALLALDPTYAAAAGVPDGTIKGFIGLAGPYAMVPSRVAGVREVFAGLPDENIARPVHFVTRPVLPPMLLLYGLDDRTVGRANAVELTALVRAAGGTVTHREYPGVGHPGLVLALAPPFRGRAPVLEDTSAFIAGVAGYSAAASRGIQ